MNANSEAGLKLSYFDRILSRRHVGHKRRTGQNAHVMSLRHGLVHSLTKPKIIRIYYDSLGHRQQV
jgi:hypothetical protein